MHPFDYVRARSVAHALAESERRPSTFLAGGTELLNWMRIGIETPERIVDLAGIQELRESRPLEKGGVRLGAMMTLNEVARSEEIRCNFPVLAQSIDKAASSQLRNLATIGGNPLQRTRCAYFRADSPIACNRRNPGTGCAAISGFNNNHAILGWDDFCVATHPSDPAVALTALNAKVHIASPRGERVLDFGELYQYSSATLNSHHVVAADELVIAIDLPFPAAHSAYLKVRERESYEFALVSCAVSLTLDEGNIEDVRVVLGSVAHKPWRLTSTEDLLRGLRPDPAQIRHAVDVGLEEAKPLTHNAYKIQLARTAAIRTITKALGVA
jgi:xanthine dehydrogenase YagS FAD-binding subunit